jgi:hypothetical protein
MDDPDVDDGQRAQFTQASMRASSGAHGPLASKNHDPTAGEWSGLRHTRATEMLMAGLRPAFSARQLGHDVAVYRSVYAKWISGADDDAEMAKREGKQEGTGTLTSNTSGARPRAD